MGNICRSPLAEAVFLHKAAERGAVDRFEVDSAGTGGWHVGEAPDDRIGKVAQEHGVSIESSARQVKRKDLKHFDLIICMDDDNREDVLKMGASEQKVHLLLEFDSQSPLLEVPDPYYGGRDGFNLVYRLVDSSCDALLDELLA